MKKVLLWSLGIICGIGALGALLGDPESSKQAVASKTENSSNIETSTGSDAAEESGADRLTGPQRNAVRSAQNYVDMMGFSRAGLIDQLSSSAGDGYDQADAIIAVDSLDIDWNQEAAQSAQNYIDMMGFSCSGLIDQLSSSAGDKYTKSEAQYGAEKVGAC
ncbi:MAG: Ltp family lipoprotein [Erythrobacter sp.]